MKTGTKQLEPASRNQRYFESTGKYKSSKEKEDNKYGKEHKSLNKNNSITGY